MIDEAKSYLEVEARKELRKTKLSDIEPIGESHLRPLSKGDLAKVIEGPLLRACECLYDKNVLTYMSGANKQNLKSGEVYFSIIYDALSERNKKIAAELVAEKIGHLSLANEVVPSCLQITIPVDSKSTWGDIEDSSEAISNRFFKQRLMPIAYTANYLISYLSAAIEEDIEGNEVIPEYFQSHGYFYDPKSGLFFEGEENLHRATEPVEGEDSSQPAKAYEVIDVNS